VRDAVPAGKIRILDPATVNKIAAGEVVERPASVVKELVENAIDAGARRIRIEIASVKGAVAGIRITDDGTGMSPGDALLAFTPHATSKITGAADLATVQTLGFRGEALSSIAAVAKVTLVTRQRGSGAVSGTKVVIEGGQLRESAETGAPEGTTVLVTDLFFNTPARKKFLKRLPTEIARITGVIEGIALAHPGILIQLVHNGRDLIASEGTMRLADTVIRVFGTDTAAGMIPVHGNRPFLSIEGFISLPFLVRKNPGRMLVAINNRYISSQPVAAAIIEGYGTLLPKDWYPVAFLSLTIDTAYVDVNVHPGKKLVRLSRESEIRQAVRESVRSALNNADLIPPGVPISSRKKSVPVPLKESLWYDHAHAPSSRVSEPTHDGTFMTERQLRQTELTTGTAYDKSRVPEMELIGQYGGIYLIAATTDGDLIIIDQHAAHERIMYELVRIKDENAPLSQELIVPVVLERSARDAAVIRGLLPVLSDEGFVIGEFGRNSFIVSAVPVLLGKTEGIAGMISDMVDDLTREDLKNPVTRREQVTRIIACRGAIKAGTVCTGEQCRRLLQQLARTRDPHTCPHGRPTMVRFSREQLDTMFRRIAH